MESGSEKPITSDTLNQSTTFKAKFRVKNPVTLKTRIADDSKDKGYFANVATPTMQLTTNDQTINDPVNEQASTFKPTGNKGYEFAYWSWDNAGNYPVEGGVGADGSYAIAKRDTQEVGGHTYEAYNDETVYLHFKTYSCEVTFSIYTKHPDQSGEEAGTLEGFTDRKVNVESTSPIALSTESGGTGGYDKGVFTINKLTSGSYGSETANGITFSTPSDITYKFAYWVRILDDQLNYEVVNDGDLVIDKNAKY